MSARTTFWRSSVREHSRHGDAEQVGTRQGDKVIRFDKGQQYDSDASSARRREAGRAVKVDARALRVATWCWTRGSARRRSPRTA